MKYISRRITLPLSLALAAALGGCQYEGMAAPGGASSDTSESLSSLKSDNDKDKDKSPCSVSDVADGARVSCGNSSSLLRHGSPGPAGLPGPQGPQGPVGPSNPNISQLFLMKDDGSEIGPLLSMTFDLETRVYHVWDAVNSAVAIYTASRRGTELRMITVPTAYYFASANCSDTPHVPIDLPQGTLTAKSSVVSKIEATTDVIAPLSMLELNVSPSPGCKPLASHHEYFGKSVQLSRVSYVSAGLPAVLPLPVRIEKR